MDNLADELARPFSVEAGGRRCCTSPTSLVALARTVLAKWRKWRRTHRHRDFSTPLPNPLPTSHRNETRWARGVLCGARCLQVWSRWLQRLRRHGRCSAKNRPFFGGAFDNGGSISGSFRDTSTKFGRHVADMPETCCAKFGADRTGATACRRSPVGIEISLGGVPRNPKCGRLAGLYHAPRPFSRILTLSPVD